MHVLLGSFVFALTLTLILVRPKGMNEAWSALLGAALMLILGLESFRQAWSSIWQGMDVLLFLLGLLILSDLLRASGFFEWAAIHAARSAAGDGHVLYRNVFLLGAATTACLSLDTTAVILTPVVAAIVGRLKLQPLAFVITCAFVANTGSLLLPVSNLTNLLFVSAYHWSFIQFLQRMFLPQCAAIAVTYWLFCAMFNRILPRRYDLENLPLSQEVLPDVPYFRGALVVLALVLVGYFIGSLIHLEPYIVALSGCAVLFLWGLLRKQVTLGILREISWSIFPFVIGLFVVVRGVENLGLAQLLLRALNGTEGLPLAHDIVASFGAGIGSNIINNIPMALLSITVLHADPEPQTRFAALLGCDLGPNLTVAGSLATMLVITAARRQGVEIGAREFLAVGIRTTPTILLASTLTLWLSYLLFR